MTLRLSSILALITAVVVAGCGSSASETSSPASSSTDVNALLKDTFANLAKVKSANLDAKLGVQGQGDTVSADLRGPFESQGNGKLPKFQLDATLNSGGKSFTAGTTWTGDKGFVDVQGTQYALSGLVAKQLKAGYEQAMQKNQGKSNASALGIDFSKWLKNGTNAGDSQAGGVDTIKITGQANVEQIVDDLQKVTEKASSLGLPSGTSVPQKLTAQQRQELIDSIKDVSIEVYTGKADRILRRIVVDADIAAASAGNAKLTFDLTLNQVGQKQSISEPKNAKPFSELAKLATQLKSSLGSSLGGLAGGSGSASGSGSSGSAPSSANIQKYAKCIQKAQGDSSKAQKCADLLTG